MRTLSCAVVFAALLTQSSGASADTIFSDDFSDGNISDWSTSGTVNAHNNESIRLRGPSSAWRTISTAGFSAVSVSMVMSASSLENADHCYAEVSVNSGSNWTTILQLDNGQDNGSHFSASAAPSGVDNNPQMQVRFRGDGATTGDYCYGQSVAVTGTSGAQTDPDIDAPASLGFGNITIGGSKTVNAVISNQGSADLSINSVGSVSAPFSISAETCTGGNIAPGNSCQVTVDFNPTSAGSYSDSLGISSNDPDESNISISLSGSASDSGGTTSNFDPLSGSGNVSRSLLTYNTLTGNGSGSLVNMSGYALPAEAANPGNTFEGSLELFGEATSGSFDEQKDSFRYTGNSDTTRKHLPEFDFEFVQTGSHLVPKERGSIASSHPEWEYILLPGRVWDENGDSGYSRVALPFALQQKNANCIHNGMMMFAFKDDGSVTDVAYQIASETCLYFQFDMWGQLDATYIPAAVSNATTLVAEYQAEVNGRMPTKPLSALNSDYPGTDYTKFATPNGKSPSAISLVGFVIDGTHYTGGCTTRQGDYPYCEVLPVPSYSSAKSIFAGTALMRLEQKYPGTMNQAISNYVPECAANGNWDDVTFNNTADMGTGNYKLAGYMSDEGASHTNDLFLPESHASKISYSCTEYPRKASPGTKWIYHTSDTYILGRAMNEYLQGLEGSSKDIYSDLLIGEVLGPLGVSPTAQFSRRTYDSEQQPFTGWGLMFLGDDIAKIGSFYASGSQPGLKQSEMDAALQKDASDRGLDPLSDYKYNNGFWAHEISADIAGCSAPLWLPFMSGYGGITVLILSNDTVYYYFADDDEYLWMDAAQEAHSIRSLCN
ncbi:choice-of-anchor D domain-containing protein [Biformimicrobium ophioploci]|nr:choice-of-anchor D domain-containing protein [Microbulbifer sp. NKW57]